MFFYLGYDRFLRYFLHSVKAKETEANSFDFFYGAGKPDGRNTILQKSGDGKVQASLTLIADVIVS
ncbi:MAG: hypothetical protein A3J84_03700 [Ignavibacteria bacterium RIFOXYA2_FULL_37_17]|nr:MAG: hypothetical protein A3J84_03700 [Ignavibacteria bacterium RIFOXYA2_FULL_37_17]